MNNLLLITAKKTLIHLLGSRPRPQEDKSLTGGLQVGTWCAVDQKVGIPLSIVLLIRLICLRFFSLEGLWSFSNLIYLLVILGELIRVLVIRLVS